MTDDRTPVRRFVLVTLWLPAAMTAAAVIVQLIALPHVPDPIAIHWGVDGSPNGFGPAWLSPVLTVALGFGIPLLIALTSLPGLRRGDRGATYRLMGAVAAGTSTLIAVLLTWTLVAQTGLADAADAPSAGWAVLLGAAAALLVGTAAWFAQPRQAAVRASAAPAATIALSPGERVAWFGETTLPRGAVVAIVAACVLVAVAAAASWFVGTEVVASVVLTVTAAALVAAALATAAFHVRVDDEGLTVVSTLGWPRFRVPLADVVSVATVEVNPMGEFGGYGLRSAPGRTGVVLRRGPAIDVERASGRHFVVTVPEAAVGAGVLLALAARAAPTS